MNILQLQRKSYLQVCIFPNTLETTKPNLTELALKAAPEGSFRIDSAVENKTKLNFNDSIRIPKNEDNNKFKPDLDHRKVDNNKIYSLIDQ